MENFRGLLQGANAQEKITSAEQESLSDSFQATLDSYTYLED